MRPQHYIALGQQQYASGSGELRLLRVRGSLEGGGLLALHQRRGVWLPAKGTGGRPEVQDAVACTRGEFRSNSVEMQYGKRMSCTCGMEGLTIGCEQQPGTALLLDVKDNLSSAEGGTVSLVEVGGTPNAWDASSQPYPTPLPERYRYAFPQVWGGELTGCRWHGGADIEDCAASDPTLPIWEGSSCHWMECSGSDIQCPPADV